MKKLSLLAAMGFATETEKKKNKYSVQMEGEKDICTTMYFNNKEKSIFII